MKTKVEMALAGLSEVRRHLKKSSQYAIAALQTSNFEMRGILMSLAETQRQMARDAAHRLGR